MANKTMTKTQERQIEKLLKQKGIPRSNMMIGVDGRICMPRGFVGAKAIIEWLEEHPDA